MVTIVKESDNPNKKNSANFEGVSQDIANYERDLVDYISDLEPQTQNLFYAGNFLEVGSGNTALKEFYNAHYRISSIQLPGTSFDMETDKLTRIPMFKACNFEYKITIDWREDVYHSVQKYHEDWMRRWYDRVHDTFRCGISGKFRSMDLIAYHYTASSNIAAFLEEPEIEPLFWYRIAGMVPIQIEGMKFDASNGRNEEVFSVQYMCSKIDLRYNKDFLSTNHGLYSTTGEADGNSTMGQVAVWSPEGIQETFNAGAASNQNLEKLRLARTLSTTYDSYLS
ncbi:MAG: hypothetical protein HUJ68_07640 [Clostridia bacterium]|nr:hypothetical protein [Clostridia bacterium]